MLFRSGSHVSGLVDELTPMVPTSALDETPQTSALEKFTKLAANLGTLPEGLDQTQPCAVGLPVELLIRTLHKMAQANGVASTVTMRRRATWVASAIPIDELKTYAARVHHDALSNPALLTTDFLGELDDFIDTLSGAGE